MDMLAPIVRSHYDASGLLDKVKAALAEFGPEDATLYVHQLARLDQFHTRGLAATNDLAQAMELQRGMAVLDLGCGIGGPARYLSAMHGVNVTGIDLSPSFIKTAWYLSQRCGLVDRTTFLVGDAVDPAVPFGSMDRVVLQHVAMNIKDRAALYRAIRRVLKPGGKAGIYDIVRVGGDPHFPVPWAERSDGSHLLSEAETREALSAEFNVEFWRDDTEVALQWLASQHAVGAPRGPAFGTIVGPRFRAMASNLVRSLHEGLVGVVLAVVAT
jgi:cyclopropane fatty-acyl-phospholipid synthase-like methyltransferase